MRGDSKRLLHLTDTHLLGDPEETLRGVNPFNTLRDVLSHAEHHFASPDGILLTGDLVQDDPSGYNQVKRAFANIRTPVFCIPGNHDVPEVMRSSLTQPPFRLVDHVVLDSWLIVLLDSSRTGRVDGELGSEQLQRLDALLNRHQSLHALICLHHHPVSTGSTWLDKIGLQDAAAFRNCVSRHPSVRAVTWGHVHQVMDTQLDGVRYLATPATCMQFLPRSEDFAVDTRTPGYRTLQLNGDGTIQTQVIWL